MTLAVRSITIDCANPYTLARWWCAAFSVPTDPDDYPDDPEASCSLGEGQARLLFERVPEDKATKNRVHIDLRPDGKRDDEVARLVGLGASVVADHRGDDGHGWMVLADPAGNEFCVERGLADA